MELPAEAKRDIGSAVEAARSRNPRLAASCLDFVRDVLLLKDAGHLFAEQREARLAFVMRWQQFTGPIVAKGLEDTVLYVYCPLLSLNEVGGNPNPSAVVAPDFNQIATERERRWRYSLSSTSTHDTKRGEDVRARINILSEIPREWQKHLNRWARWNKKRKRVVGSQEIPDRNEENFLYQTLLGAWPLEQEAMPHFRARLEAYVIKAIREAMVHTRWTRPNTGHERAVVGFVKALIAPARGNLFLNDFLKFQRKVAVYGMLNGLAQVLVKMTSPGVPDFYQGCDLWDLHLVDPDNRGPVDFTHRAALLDEIEKRSKQEPLRLARELVQNWQDGRIKLYLIWRILNLRRKHPRVFLDGQFLPLKTIGGREANLIAYARRRGNTWIMTIVPRCLARAKASPALIRLQKFWHGSHIALPENAPESWVNALTGETVETGRVRRAPTLSLPDVFKDLPVAVLSGVNGSWRTTRAQA
jgi:(1->4)-alpha-D-glucan 1-alpha-D-glucosylmutase